MSRRAILILCVSVLVAGVIGYLAATTVSNLRQARAETAALRDQLAKQQSSVAPQAPAIEPSQSAPEPTPQTAPQETQPQPERWQPVIREAFQLRTLGTRVWRFHLNGEALRVAVRAQSGVSWFVAPQGTTISPNVKVITPALLANFPCSGYSVTDSAQDCDLSEGEYALVMQDIRQGGTAVTSALGTLLHNGRLLERGTAANTVQLLASNRVP
jgi:hypothetical protein